MPPRAQDSCPQTKSGKKVLLSVRQTGWRQSQACAPHQTKKNCREYVVSCLCCCLLASEMTAWIYNGFIIMLITDLGVGM